MDFQGEAVRFDISDYQKLSSELVSIVEIRVERSVTGVKMLKSRCPRKWHFHGFRSSPEASGGLFLCFRRAAAQSK